jgi:hypothetical protein
MAGGPAPVELNADCTACGLEAGVVELYDALVPACRFGVPATSRCNLCGIQHEGAFDRTPAREMREIPANRCPACVTELGPRALDDRRCAKCGATATLSLVAPGASLDSEVAVVAALEAWAARDRWASREALADSVFCDPDIASLVLRIRRGEPLEVVADPFANMGVRTTGGGAAEKAKGTARAQGPAPAAVKVSPDGVTVNPSANPLRIATPAQTFRVDQTMPDPGAAFGSVSTDPFAAPLAPRQRISVPPPAAVPADAKTTLTSAGVVPANGAAPLPSLPPPTSAPPRAIVYPLVSVIAADGEIHPAERALIDRFLESEGLAPLGEHEFRVHHPSEVAHLVPKERREMVVQLMCETASVDGMPDESERRVIRAYAAEWGVPDEKVEFWMWGYESMSTSLVRQLWMKLRRFVLSARWSDAGQEGR